MNDNSSLHRLVVSAKFIINALTHCLETLRDSWAEQSFIDQVLAKELNIPLVTLPEQGQVSALNDPRFLDITHHAQSMSLSLSGETVERLVSSCLMHTQSKYRLIRSLCSSLTRSFLVEVPDLSSVPVLYHELAEEFALSLPPHRPDDWGIDLLLSVPSP